MKVPQLMTNPRAVLLSFPSFIKTPKWYGIRWSGLAQSYYSIRASLLKLLCANLSARIFAARQFRYRRYRLGLVAAFIAHCAKAPKKPSCLSENLDHLRSLLNF